MNITHAVIAVLLAISPIARTWGADLSQTALVQGNNEFALNLYRHLSLGKKGNIFCSPYSISSALAMTYAGARGETARETAQTLRFPQPLERLHEIFGGLNASINTEGKSGKINLSVANALWGQKGFGFKAEFLALTQKHYEAGLHELDFRTDAKGSRRTINAWIEKETQEKIKDLIGHGVLNSSTRLVLTNAIYFKGNWASQFKKYDTKDEPFHMEAGKDVRVPLMNQTGIFGYMETPEFQALELPYAGDRLSMVVLLPQKPAGLPRLENDISEKHLTEWLRYLSRRKVIVYLPKFKTTSEFRLGPTLQSMGVKAAFIPPSKQPRPDEADFSGMNGKRDLYISEVIHKAFVDVNEEGTEAAAATAVHMMITTSSLPPPVPVFRADHPFLFLIRDRNSGSILFLGRIANPRS